MKGLRFLSSFAVLALLPWMSAQVQAMVCKPNYDYSVEVDGAYPKNATLYQSSNPGMYFVDVPACKAGLVMDMKGKRVVTVARDQVKPVEGGVEIDDSVVAPPAMGSDLLLEGPVVGFKAEDKKVRILRCLDRPPIVGIVEMDALVSDRPEYREGMKLYTPDAESISAIGKYGKKVQIDAFFATWCPHCKEYMPKFLRVMADAKNPRIKLNLYGVPKGFSAMPGPWQGRNINAIPTIIVKIDGREITRLGAQPGAIPESELAGIFSAVR